MAKKLTVEQLNKLIFEANLPGAFDGDKYILDSYNLDPEIFTYWFNKAQNSANKRRFGKSENSLWIAANSTSTIVNYPHSFYCYYCMLDFGSTKIINPEFEHFTPQIQEAGNIVFACSFCNRLKDNKKPEEFWDQLYNPNILKGLKPLNKHFAPLVVRHHSSSAKNNWKRLDWLSYMKKFAKEDFGVEILENQQYETTSEYCKLFRERYQI